MASEQLPERATARDIDARSALALLLLVARQGDEFFRRGFGVELPLDAGRLFRRVQRVRHLGFAEDWKRDARGLVHWLIRHQGQLVICKSDLTAAPLELHNLFGILRILAQSSFIILAPCREFGFVFFMDSLKACQPQTDRSCQRIVLATTLLD